MDLFERVMELSRYGYFCGQILAILMLETLGEDDPLLVKAMGGLNGGVGFSQGCCGCMTGGACLISSFTGKGEETGYDDPAGAGRIYPVVRGGDDRRIRRHRLPRHHPRQPGQAGGILPADHRRHL